MTLEFLSHALLTLGLFLDQYDTVREGVHDVESILNRLCFIDFDFTFVGGLGSAAVSLLKTNNDIKISTYTNFTWDGEEYESCCLWYNQSRDLKYEPLHLVYGSNLIAIIQGLMESRTNGSSRLTNEGYELL